MISYKLQVENYSQMENDLILKIYKIANCLRRIVGNKMHKAFPLPVMEFPLPGEVPTASEESSHCQKKRDATAQKIALLLKSSSNCQSKSYDSYAKMPPKRTSTSDAPTMNQVAIRKLVIDSVAAALEVQAANMENADNANRNPKLREAHVARKCSYKEFMSCQPFNFKDYKVKFANGTLTEEALSWWNSFAQLIGIEDAYKITWFKFKKLLIKKYFPRNEVQNMEDEFYHLAVKGNDLNTYIRRF
nr:reverse transcriptase domain-containing protein [Tanacetum cinerariifolium]